MRSKKGVACSVLPFEKGPFFLFTLFTRAQNTLQYKFIYECQYTTTVSSGTIWENVTLNYSRKELNPNFPRSQNVTRSFSCASSQIDEAEEHSWPWRTIPLSCMDPFITRIQEGVVPWALPVYYAPSPLCLNTAHSKWLSFRVSCCSNVNRLEIGIVINPCKLWKRILST